MYFVLQENNTMKHTKIVSRRGESGMSKKMEGVNPIKTHCKHI
jgi:hypothetical protein